MTKLPTTLWHDLAGNSWQITLDIDVIRRVRTTTGFDLATLFTPEGMNGLAADFILLADVIWQCVLPQAEAKNVTHAQFVQGLKCQAIENASAALVQAAIDFLPPSRAALLTRLRDRAEAMAEVMTLEAEKAIANLEQQPSFGSKLPS